MNFEIFYNCSLQLGMLVGLSVNCFQKPIVVKLFFFLDYRLCKWSRRSISIVRSCWARQAILCRIYVLRYCRCSS